MDFPDPLDEGKTVSLELKHSRSPSIEINLRSNPIRIRIKEGLEGDLLGAQSDVDYSDPQNISKLESSLRERMEKRQKELIESIFHQYQADPFGILKKARSHFITEKEMEQYDFQKAMKTADIDVHVDFQLRRIGVQLAPPHPK
jgi:spore germination protein KC